MNALRCHNENFSDWAELQARQFRDQARDVLLTDIHAAVDSGDVSKLLLVFGKLREFAQRVFIAEAAHADHLYVRFPFAEFDEMRQGRNRQMTACSSYFDEVSRRITAESQRHPGSDSQDILVGSYLLFFRGFCSGDSSADDAEAVLKLGKKFAGSDSSAMPGGAAPSSSRGASAPRVPAGAGRGLSGGGAGASAAKASSRSQPGLRFVRGRTIPSSESIIGPHLGIAGPDFECRGCKETGHWIGECPVYWGSQGDPLPGWKANGKKDKKAWDGANPTKETFKNWVRFINAHFVGGGQPAGLEGAPSLSDYKDRARNGAGP